MTLNPKPLNRKPQTLNRRFKGTGRGLFLNMGLLGFLLGGCVGFWSTKHLGFRYTPTSVPCQVSLL